MKTREVPEKRRKCQIHYKTSFDNALFNLWQANYNNKGYGNYMLSEQNNMDVEVQYEDANDTSIL